MTATDGREIRRKCLHIWKGRLCLCQFLGWIDDGKKYHCTYHQMEDAMDSTDRQYPDVPAPQIAKLPEPPKPVDTGSRPKELDSFRDHDKVAISHTKIEGPNTHKLSAFEHFTPYDGHFVRDRHEFSGAIADDNEYDDYYGDDGMDGMDYYFDDNMAMDDNMWIDDDGIE